MPAHRTITVDARRYADADDCLHAAAAAYVAAHPAVAGYDLAPRWGDDDRETIALDVPASAAPRVVWRVTTSNGRFYQIHDVVAVDEAAARTLAESEDGANEPWILAEEAADAATVGDDPAGRYVACRVEEVEGVDPDDYDQIAFVDAGAEG